MPVPIVTLNHEGVKLRIPLSTAERGSCRWVSICSSLSYNLRESFTACKCEKYLNEVRFVQLMEKSPVLHRQRAVKGFSLHCTCS